MLAVSCQFTIIFVCTLNCNVTGHVINISASLVLRLLKTLFPHTDAFCRLCSRQLFENIVAKEEIAHDEQFLLLPQCFLLLVIGYLFNYREFPFFDKIIPKPSAAYFVYVGKGYKAYTS